MSPTDYERYYVRHLPHVQPISATFFVTCRLAGTIPQRVRSALLEEAKREGEHLDRLEDSNERRQQAYLFHRRSFGRWDAVLDSSAQGPTWLREERVAQMVAESLHYRQDKVWDLLAYCLMPNHLHIVFTPLVDSDGHCPTATAIMQSFKGYTAHKANVLLHRQEAFWQHESYDHWVRDEDELARIITYVINNPVKAGLVERWEDWPWTYSQYAS